MDCDSSQFWQNRQRSGHPDGAERERVAARAGNGRTASSRSGRRARRPAGRRPGFAVRRSRSSARGTCPLWPARMSQRCAHSRQRTVVGSCAWASRGSPVGSCGTRRSRRRRAPTWSSSGPSGPTARGPGSARRASRSGPAGDGREAGRGGCGPGSRGQERAPGDHAAILHPSACHRAPDTGPPRFAPRVTGCRDHVRLDRAPCPGRP